MPKYNLDALGQEEFEHLCQSLVQQIIGPGAKVYGMGSDGAREATFDGKAPYPSEEEQWDGRWIFQAKFHDVQQIGPKVARRTLLVDLDDELSKITEKYKHPCDNFILMTNVSLTPVFQKGIKDRIDNKIIPKYHHAIKHIHVWGADEVCRFLDAHPGIRQSFAHLLVSGDIIARLLRLIKKEETDLDELVKLYCQGCYNHEQYAALDDAGDVEDERIALQCIFIDLDVEPPTLLQNQQLLERLPEWLKQAAEDDERKSALSYLLDDSVLGLVLIGGPGEGKSTLAQYLAQIHRARLIGQLNELGEEPEMFEKCIPRVPFRILLKEYAQWISSKSNSDSLFHYLSLQVSQASGKDSVAEQIHKIMKSCPSLIILDGLDEVPEKKLRAIVLDNITSFVNQVRNVLKGDIRVIATTRPYGYSEEFDPTHYLHLTLQRLTSEKAAFYAKKWAYAREPNPVEAKRIRDTFDMCLKDKVVSVLTQTPLQVTIILVIVRARGTPPKQREELFERYMDIIYQREQKKRPELLRTAQDIIYGLHKYLAYVLHRRAEKDKTAALMDVSEFRERVKEYLIYSNPLLREEELETQVKQIITEASQRLVLIESPQAERFGFGLTTTREFFAAAHLVDTAKDTKERDLRFKAISRSPYWRNVALFFAGRVGRTRPGEAPSMIDVCRKIDTERVDNFLRRGSELVMEMVDDRVLREPHNEIGAIQYGLTQLNSGYIKEYGELVNKLKSLPDEYKERVIRPWTEDRLKNVVPENLNLYADIYQDLFGMSGPLHDTIKRAAESDSRDVRLWVLSEAIKNRIAESWVAELLEELVDIYPIEKIAGVIGEYWSNFRFYLDFSFSLKASTVIAFALLEGAMELGRGVSKDSKAILDQLSMIIPKGKPKGIWLLLWAVSQLLTLSYVYLEEAVYRRKDRPIVLRFPNIANPKLKAKINENARFIKEFCETYSKANEPFTDLLIAALGFLLEPHNLEKYIDISKALRETENHSVWVARIVSLICGEMPQDEEKLCEHHKDLFTLYEYYESQDQYRKDYEEINEIINRNSKSIRNHPYKLAVWIESNHDPIIEKLLDPEILSEAKGWFQARGLSGEAVFLRESWTLRIDFELIEFLLETFDRQLEEGQKRLRFDPTIAFYQWKRSKRDSTAINRLKRIFENVLTNYSSLIDTEYQVLELLYWSALNACIVEEKHLSKLYSITHNVPDFLKRPWLGEEGTNNSLPVLLNMLREGNLEVARLAALSLSGVSQHSRFIHEVKKVKKVMKEPWIGDKYWELSTNKQDVWRPRYIEGMARCSLKWAEKNQEWIKAIKEANTERLQSSWCAVIENAGYYKRKDRNAFFDLLLHVLESGNTFAKPVRRSALWRLYRIVSEVEPIGFDEEPLNLPLSRTIKASF